MKQILRKKPHKILFLALLSLLLLWNLGQPLKEMRVQAKESPLRQGESLYQQKRFSEAVSVFKTAARIYGSQGDILQQAAALSNLSLTYQQLQQWNLAESASQQSINLLETSLSPDYLLILGQVLEHHGQLQLTTGKLEAALLTWQKATTVYQQLHNHPAVNRCRLNMAYTMQQMGLYPRAITTLQKLLDSLKKEIL